MPVTSAQVRMARAALNWTVRDLAVAAGLHRNTITNIEVGRYVGDPETLSTIENVLRRAGVEFIDENGGGPGVRLRSRSQGKPHRLSRLASAARQLYFTFVVCLCSERHRGAITVRWAAFLHYARPSSPT